MNWVVARLNAEGEKEWWEQIQEELITNWLYLLSVSASLEYRQAGVQFGIVRIMDNTQRPGPLPACSQRTHLNTHKAA